MLFFLLLSQNAKHRGKITDKEKEIEESKLKGDMLFTLYLKV